MTAVATEPKTETPWESSATLRTGEWVFFYSLCRMNKCPAPGLVCKDANAMNVVTLEVFSENGPYTRKAVMEGGDPRLVGNRDLIQNGCWSRERVDL
jgi:hypothetical protein